jgi:hypothetical protein
MEGAADAGCRHAVGQRPALLAALSGSDDALRGTACRDPCAPGSQAFALRSEVGLAAAGACWRTCSPGLGRRHPVPDAGRQCSAASITSTATGPPCSTATVSTRCRSMLTSGEQLAVWTSGAGPEVQSTVQVRRGHQQRTCDAAGPTVATCVPSMLPRRSSRRGRWPGPWFSAARWLTWSTRSSVSPVPISAFSSRCAGVCPWSRSTKPSCRGLACGRFP